MTATDQKWDVIVIGAGPAGSAAATVLAEAGRRVLILEKEPFPRYRVGESLLPFCYYPLERLGLLGAMKQSLFVKKHSVQFISKDGHQSNPFYFFDHMQNEAALTWQVERSHFDEILVTNAQAKGAVFAQGVEVRDLISAEDGRICGVKARHADGQVTDILARVTVDASGRNAISAARNRWRMMDRQLKKVAIWTYFKGAKRDPGRDEGATTVAYTDNKSWFWYIPLQNDLVSVGLVGDKSQLFQAGEVADSAAVFEREQSKSSWLTDHLAGSHRVEDYKTTGDFSFRSKYCAGHGLVLTGDAFAFLDPVFSSGVFLALQGGVMAGEAVHEALGDNDIQAQRFEAYGSRLCHMLESMRRLVYAFYDPDFSFKDLFGKYPELRGDVTNCLIGDLERDYEDLFRAIGEFATLPQPVPFGVPQDVAS